MRRHTSRTEKSRDRRSKTSRAVLVYDQECGLCRAAVDWVQARALPDALLFVPCRSEERRRLLPDVELERCLRAVILALPDGRVLEGEETIPEILARTRRWRWLSGFLRVPGLDRLSGPIYRWVAENRAALSHLLGV